ncbi:fibronectin type III domain-containing protein [Flavobacterium sp. WW92]|uniref:fibronectin type III domain-containing protein n=1 Tax=unclassified Flavobacterium TaxID=196869 RepID=UPI002224F337|nr:MULTISPECIES: fibronectin type III domain-containing protein [unclassified Flavobacterium]WDO11624.1 fibronectin type III domain-containing protein [Flavobacterium sp. WW92]
MSRIKIITSFGRYNDANLEQKAELIADSMTNNPHFEDPVPAIADLKEATIAFDEAIIKAKEGGKREQLRRDDKRKELIVLLDKLALYVHMKADGDKSALASSGFTLSKIPEAIGILSKPQNFMVRAENAGSIKLSIKTIRGAKSYQYEYRKKGETIWQIWVHTKTTLLLTNLESGQQYEFRIAAIGAAMQRVYSDVISSYVL